MSKDKTAQALTSIASGRGQIAKDALVVAFKKGGATVVVNGSDLRITHPATTRALSLGAVQNNIQLSKVPAELHSMASLVLRHYTAAANGSEATCLAAGAPVTEMPMPQQ